MWSSSSRIQASLFRRTPLGLTLLPARPPHNSSSFSCITGLSTQQETGRAAERARNDSAHQPASTAFAIRVQAGSNHHASGSHVATHMWQSNQLLSPRARRARTRAVSLALHGFQSASQRHASHRTRTVSERSSQASQGGPRPPKKLRQGGLRPPPSS